MLIYALSIKVNVKHYPAVFHNETLKTGINLVDQKYKLTLILYHHAKEDVYTSLRKTQKDVLRVFVLFCVLVFVLAILSWCP